MRRISAKVPILFIIAGIATGLWAYLTFHNIYNVSNRTSNETTATEPSPPSDSSNLAETEVVISESPSNPDEESTPVRVPAPEDRVPASPLTEQMRRDMNIEDTIEEEGIFFATAVPNDPIYPQWYTTIISAPTAWDTTTGSASTLVAVIDTGFALDHEDLTSAWFINDGEQGTTQSGDVCWTGTPADKSTNGCDDDGNTYVDDWRGWDFSANDNNVQTATNSATGSSHGTKSAGLVGGRSNNSLGVASVNWQTEILPLQALYDEGYGFSSDIASAIYYAVNMGADVINMSLGGPGPDSYTRAAVRYAEAAGVIVVASSGNCGDQQTSPDCTGYPSPGGMGYPGRYPETIAVGATTSSDTQASFSSWGDEITLVAPGSGTIQTPTWISTNETSAYSSTSYGTSFSAPIVSGAMALLKAEMPNITREEAIALIANSSDKVAGMGGSNWTQRFGYGRLNVASLLDELANYKRQLQKGAGQISEYSPTVKPLVTSNTGHSTSTQITNGTTVKTYCVTSPNTVCRLTLDKRNSSSLVVVGDRYTNSQGIAIFEWDYADVSTGTWDAYVTANSLNSSLEKLIVN